MFALPAWRHELSFHQSRVLFHECGQEVDTLSAWVDAACAGRQARPTVTASRRQVQPTPHARPDHV
jgi:hypothetical protein